MLIAFVNWLARRLSALADVLEEWSRRLKRCSDCGRSQFYGKPCKNVPDDAQAIRDFLSDGAPGGM